MITYTALLGFLSFNAQEELDSIIRDLIEQ